MDMWENYVVAQRQKRRGEEGVERENMFIDLWKQVGGKSVKYLKAIYWVTT